MSSHPIVGILALWFAARAFGTLANMARQPAVVGELLAGVLFSPSFAGQKYHVGSPLLTQVAFYAGAAFLFFAGFEIQLSSVTSRLRIGIVVALAGAIIPFALGFGFGSTLPSHFGFDGRTTPAIFGMFLGISMAVSALPVIARTLMDVGIYHSPIGSITMSAVIIDDILGWLAFSLIIATGIHSEPGAWIRFHMPVFAYLLGVIVGEMTRKRKIPAKDTAVWLANRALSPIFFGAIGLKLGNFANFDWKLTLILIGIATVGKVFACTVAARFSGVSGRDSWAVGFAMNSRGAMSVLLSSLSHELGVISDRLFLSLVIMAIVTSMISGPALRQILKPAGDSWK